MSEAIAGIIIDIKSKYDVNLWSERGIVQEITIRLKKPIAFNPHDRVIMFVDEDQSEEKLEKMTKFNILEKENECIN